MADQGSGFNMAEEALADKAEALAQVMSMYRYDMSAIEAESWKAVMRAAPADQFKAFLQSHILSGGGFPPRPGEAARTLGLVVDPESAFLTVQRLARELGPYREPQIVDPVLITAIQYMGGWCTLCEQMPDPRENFALKSFKERFAAAFNQAGAAVNVRKELPAQPLLSLSTRRAPALLAAAVRPATTLPGPERVRPNPHGSVQGQVVPLRDSRAARFSTPRS